MIPRHWNRTENISDQFMSFLSSGSRLTHGCYGVEEFKKHGKASCSIRLSIESNKKQTNVELLETLACWSLNTSKDNRWSEYTSEKKWKIRLIRKSGRFWVIFLSTSSASKCKALNRKRSRNDEDNSLPNSDNWRRTKKGIKVERRAEKSKWWQVPRRILGSLEEHRLSDDYSLD